MVYYSAVLRFAIQLEIHFRTTPDSKLNEVLRTELLPKANKIYEGLDDLERTYPPADVIHVGWYHRTRDLCDKVYALAKAVYRGTMAPHKAADKAMKLIKHIASE